MCLWFSHWHSFIYCSTISAATLDMVLFLFVIGSITPNMRRIFEGSTLTAIWFIYETTTPEQGRKLALRTTQMKRNISGLLKTQSKRNRFIHSWIKKQSSSHNNTFSLKPRARGYNSKFVFFALFHEPSDT